jgi:hypothetical protein
VGGKWKFHIDGLIARLASRKPLLLCIGVAALVLAVALFRYNPEEIPFCPRCPVCMLTGLKCPGCGTARALHCLLHGDVASAVAFNPLLVLAFPLLVLLLLFPGLARSATLCWVVFATMLLYMAVRNVI